MGRQSYGWGGSGDGEKRRRGEWFEGKSVEGRTKSKINQLAICKSYLKSRINYLNI
jgi:hypothetical protein